MMHLTDFPPDRQCFSPVVCECHGLEQLFRSGLGEAFELCLWNRSPQPEWHGMFSGLNFDPFRDFRQSGEAAEILSAFSTYCEQLNGWPQATLRFLQEEVRAFLMAMRETEANYTLRLEYVTDDACRRFHKDQTDLRLITTYAGPGTQWTENEEGAEGPVRQMQPFALGLFRGQRRRGTNRVLHRSPPIEGSGLVRLMMVLDIERAGWSKREDAYLG